MMIVQSPIRILRHNAIDAWQTMLKTGWVRCSPRYLSSQQLCQDEGIGHSEADLNFHRVGLSKGSVEPVDQGRWGCLSRVRRSLRLLLRAQLAHHQQSHESEHSTTLHWTRISAAVSTLETDELSHGGHNWHSLACVPVYPAVQQLAG